MKYMRYGKMKLRNHLSNCFFCLFFLLFGIIGISEGTSRIRGVIFVGIAILDMIHISIPYGEKFLVNESTIIAYKKRKIKSINLPSKITVVISYADMCTDLAKRVTLYNNTYMLKDEWAISLLEDVFVENVIEHLHDNGACRYTNCWTEHLLKQNFVYSFVCNQSMLEEVLDDKNYTLIIPETLLRVVDTQKLKGDIYIDKGY